MVVVGKVARTLNLDRTQLIISVFHQMTTIKSVVIEGVALIASTTICLAERDGIFAVLLMGQHVIIGVEVNDVCI